MDETHDMGMNPVLSSQIIFPRTFRFLFVPKKNPDLKFLVSKLQIDYFGKTIDAFMMELAHLPAHDWIMQMNERNYSDDITLIALDGCGTEIYVLEFIKAKAIWHSVEYDYSKSDVVTHQVGLEYQEMKVLKRFDQNKVSEKTQTCHSFSPKK